MVISSQYYSFLRENELFNYDEQQKELNMFLFRLDLLWSDKVQNFSPIITCFKSTELAVYSSRFAVITVMNIIYQCLLLKGEISFVSDISLIFPCLVCKKC